MPSLVRGFIPMFDVMQGVGLGGWWVSWLGAKSGFIFHFILFLIDDCSIDRWIIK
jgi:hypothetical protein